MYSSIYIVNYPEMTILNDLEWIQIIIYQVTNYEGIQYIQHSHPISQQFALFYQGIRKSLLFPRYLVQTRSEVRHFKLNIFNVIC